MRIEAPHFKPAGSSRAGLTQPCGAPLFRSVDEPQRSDGAHGTGLRAFLALASLNHQFDWVVDLQVGEISVDDAVLVEIDEAVIRCGNLAVSLAGIKLGDTPLEWRLAAPFILPRQDGVSELGARQDVFR